MAESARAKLLAGIGAAGGKRGLEQRLMATTGRGEPSLDAQSFARLCLGYGLTPLESRALFELNADSSFPRVVSKQNFVTSLRFEPQSSAAASNASAAARSAVSRPHWKTDGVSV